MADLNLTKAQMTKIVNDVWEAVDGSQAGPIYALDPKDKTKASYDPSGHRIANNIGMQTFQNVLNSVMPKFSFGEFTHKEPKQPWQG